MTEFLEPMGITRDKLAGPGQTVLLGPTQTVTATRPIRHLNPLLSRYKRPWIRQD